MAAAHVAGETEDLEVCLVIAAALQYAKPMMHLQHTFAAVAPHISHALPRALISARRRPSVSGSTPARRLLAVRMRSRVVRLPT
jgi:methylmalonyl-CoA mutase N-terminal domain/subunit